MAVASAEARHAADKAGRLRGRMGWQNGLRSLVLLAGVTWLVVGCGSALRDLRASAEGGDTRAQLKLGERHAAGDGVPQSHVEAVRWYKRAADRGNADAQLALGLSYRDGLGVPQDYEEARRWIQRSADNGAGEAQYLLGRLYEDGQGVPRDLVRAHMWFNLASASLKAEERESALRKREWLASVITPVELEEAQRLAREWAGARRGHAK